MIKFFYSLFIYSYHYLKPAGKFPGLPLTHLLTLPIAERCIELTSCFALDNLDDVLRKTRRKPKNSRNNTASRLLIFDISDVHRFKILIVLYALNQKNEKENGTLLVIPTRLLYETSKARRHLRHAKKQRKGKSRGMRVK